MEYFHFPSLIISAAAWGGTVLVDKIINRLKGDISTDPGVPFHESQLSQTDELISRLSSNYALLSTKLLKEFIKFPSLNPDFNIQSLSQQFSEFLIQKIIELKAVSKPENVTIDDNGNVVWFILNEDDQTPLKDRKIIFINSSYSCFFENDTNWKDFGPGLDKYGGLIDKEKVRSAELDKLLAYVPTVPTSKEWWPHLTFGAGASSGLHGISSQIFAMKIMLESKSLENVIVFASIARNQHMPYHYIAGEKLYPDAIIISEPTGRVEKGPCGIAIGQNGQTLIDVSAPRGFPMEDGCRIIAEAAATNINKQVQSNESIFGPTTLITRNAVIEPSGFSVQFIKTRNVGQSAELALEEIENLPSVLKAKEHGAFVQMSEVESCPAWKTPFEHPALLAMAESYRRSVSPYIHELHSISHLKPAAFFTVRGHCDNSQGYPMKLSEAGEIRNDNWIHINLDSGEDLLMPPMMAIGSGYIENSNRPGEFVINDNTWAPIAVISRFPSLLAQKPEILKGKLFVKASE